MSVFSAGRTGVAVLRADRQLGAGMSAARRARAEALSATRVLRRDVGRWDASEDAEHAREGFGLLIVEGMVVRRVGLERRYGAELLSAGDLVQPAEHDGEGATLPFEAVWRVLVPLRLAVLDLRWAARMAPFPELAAELTRRALRRSLRLASMLAILQNSRLEDRLTLFFWELADRYGHVGTDGVHVDLPLTHELIAELVAARRPSVSAALSRLEQDGRLQRNGRGWLLRGEPLTLTDLDPAPA